MNYNKIDLNTFEYDKRYSNIKENEWDFIKDDKKYEEYTKKRDKIKKPNINRVQSDPEKTGQIGTMI